MTGVCCPGYRRARRFSNIGAKPPDTVAKQAASGESVMTHPLRMLALGCAAAIAAALPAAAQSSAPQFQPEPFWPKPLPENWILGQVSGIAVDRQDNIWILHRPATLLDDEKGAQKDPPETTCCKAAPPVLKLDPEGNLLASWGGASGGGSSGGPWVKNEHGIHVDRDGNVWVGGNSDGDQILKFSPDGKFLQQVGKDDGGKGSLSQTRLGRPAHMITDDAAGEIYVADGYGNHRIIVFDAKTGAFKRMWGAYGKPPSDDKMPPYKPDAKLSEQFANPVHCVRLSNDGLVYVCDRANNRIQVFRKDGSFVKEFRVSAATVQSGSVWDLVLSEDPQQKFMFVADGANGNIVTLDRDSGKELAKWGRHGRQPGQFKWIHNIAIDSRGNLYTAEVGFGRRAQKFRRTP
jgi:DNA-binding beta-propeller fold protein YncE